MPINKQEELEEVKWRQRLQGWFEQVNLLESKPNVQGGQLVFKGTRVTLTSLINFIIDVRDKSILEAKQEARKAILEEVRSLIDKDEEENDCVKRGHRVVNCELGVEWCNDCWLSEDSTKDEEAVGRNKLRAEQRQKLNEL